MPTYIAIPASKVLGEPVVPVVVPLEVVAGKYHRVSPMR